MQAYSSLEWFKPFDSEPSVREISSSFELLLCELISVWLILVWEENCASKISAVWTEIHARRNWLLRPLSASHDCPAPTYSAVTVAVPVWSPLAFVRGFEEAAYDRKVSVLAVSEICRSKHPLLIKELEVKPISQFQNHPQLHSEIKKSNPDIKL